MHKQQRPAEIGWPFYFSWWAMLGLNQRPLDKGKEYQLYHALKQ
jgi:hypothetical protein